jgi:hypothetical protein
MVGFGPPASRQARREWLRRQIQRQQHGSLTVTEFCRRLGASTVSFDAWKRRFRETPPARRLYLELLAEPVLCVALLRSLPSSLSSRLTRA